MANSFNTFAGGFPAFPTGLTGRTIESGRTPSDAFAYSTAQMQPFWARRMPSSISPMLRAQYALSATPSFSPSGAYQSPASFSEFVRTPLQERYMSGPDLLRRARLVAQAPQMSELQFAGRFAPGGSSPDPREFARRSALYQQFGPRSPDMMQNQMEVARLLGRQAPGGQVYSGLLGGAIDRALSNLWMRQADAGAPPGGFLNRLIARRML